MPKKIAVIGGGIAGIEISIKLSLLGFKVYLLEKRPFLGGNAVNLYKFFPTDDCSTCISLGDMRTCFYRSKLSEIRNLKILTGVSITNIRNSNKEFEIEILKQPTYIDASKCRLCGACVEVCKSNAILAPQNLQAIPLSYVIDIEKCSKCYECSNICKFSAINLDEGEEKQKLNVHGIVIATGFEEWKPEEIKNYGYGRYRNVITQLELAEMLCKGNLPEGDRFLMILCVGSRDKHHRYCSKICCTYALKHAIMLRELGKDVSICYIDIRTYGRHEEYYTRARELGVRFIRGKPGEIVEDRKSEKLKVFVEDIESGELKEEIYDVVVLTPALIPSPSNKKIAEMLGIDIDEYGFIRQLNPKLRKVETGKKGIYVCGCASGIKDVSEIAVETSSLALDIYLDIGERKW